MALLTLTINNPSTALDKQHQETQLISRALQVAQQDIRANGGKKTSGNINGDGGVLLGTWTYTPVATS
jgi:hypothetical protein